MTLNNNYMENHITQILLGILILIVAGKPAFNFLKSREQSAGAISVLSHIFKAIKEKGFIKISLNGEEITLIEKPKENA